jgi:hypothetical protein
MASSPTPVTPRSGAAVDGSAAYFSWEPVPNAHAYRVQIAAEAAFDTPLYTIEVENVTELTLLEMLPDDGSVYYWRVQAVVIEERHPWSTPTRFVAAEKQTVHGPMSAISTTGEPSPIASMPTSPTSSAPPAEMAPYQHEHTKGSTMAGFLLLMVVSFIAMLVAVFSIIP